MEITTINKRIDAEKSRTETVEEKVRLDIETLGDNLHEKEKRLNIRIDSLEAMEKRIHTIENRCD
jgi:hypothetical protein